jgi:hypothetical protein
VVSCQWEEVASATQGGSSTDFADFTDYVSKSAKSAPSVDSTVFLRFMFVGA